MKVCWLEQQCLRTNPRMSMDWWHDLGQAYMRLWLLCTSTYSTCTCKYTIGVWTANLVTSDHTSYSLLPIPSHYMYIHVHVHVYYHHHQLHVAYIICRVDKYLLMMDFKTVLLLSFLASITVAHITLWRGREGEREREREREREKIVVKRRGH